jgi:hypothetical protein
LCDAAVLPQKGQDGLAGRGGNVGFSVCHAAQLDSAWQRVSSRVELRVV